MERLPWRFRAIEKVASGEGYVDPGAHARLPHARPRGDAHGARAGDPPAPGRRDVNADVAKKLFISQETVKSHVRHILAKLEADTRTKAVAIALRQAIIRIDAWFSAHPTAPPATSSRVRSAILVCLCGVSGEAFADVYRMVRGKSWPTEVPGECRGLVRFWCVKAHPDSPDVLTRLPHLGRRV